MAYIVNDMSASPVAVYALRKLVSTYSGSAIRVRRSNDNAEQGIGFTIDGDLDTTALSTFVGSNSAYVVTWYDQSGNNYDLSQSTSGNQPRIVNEGIIDVDTNSKAIVKFISSRYPSLVKNTGVTWNQPNTILSIAKFNYSNSAGTIIDAYSSSNRHKIGASLDKIIIYAGTTLTHSSSTLDTNTNIITGKYNSSNSAIYKNGSSIATGNAGSQNMAGITLGANNGGSTYNLDGHIQEIVIFNSSLSDTDRRYLETNQGDYYGITVANPLYPIPPETGIEVDAIVADVPITVKLSDVLLGINFDSIVTDIPITSTIVDVNQGINVDSIITDISITATFSNISVGINVDSVISDVPITAQVVETEILSPIVVDTIATNIPITSLITDVVTGINVESILSDIPITTLLSETEIISNVEVDTIIVDVPITSLVNDVEVKSVIVVDTVIVNVPVSGLVADIIEGITIEAQTASITITSLLTDVAMTIEIDCIAVNIPIVQLTIEATIIRTTMNYNWELSYLNRNTDISYKDREVCVSYE